MERKQIIKWVGRDATRQNSSGVLVLKEKREKSKWRLILRNIGVINYENEEKVRTMVF